MRSIDSGAWSRPRFLSVLIGVVAVGAIPALARAADAVEVTMLHPVWASNSEAVGVGGDFIVGSANPSGPWMQPRQPVRWTLSSGAVVMLPQLAESDWGVALSVGDESIVGIGGPGQRAVLWGGEGLIPQSLHPEGALDSVAGRGRAGMQVGHVYKPDIAPNAVSAALWTGTAESFQSLHPVGAFESFARDTDGVRQVGYVQYPGATGFRAVLWSGSAESDVQLHPTGFHASYALAMDGPWQGGAVVAEAPSGPFKAVVWEGSAESMVMLHGDEMHSSQVLAMHGCAQVGWFTHIASEFNERAVLWRGTSDGFVNLHAALDAMYVSSRARDVYVADDGTILIVGHAVGPAGPIHAVLWRVTPQTCRADLNGDGHVDLEDLLTLLAAWGSCAGPGCCEADLDGDDFVGLTDLLVLLSLWGACAAGEM